MPIRWRLTIFNALVIGGHTLGIRLCTLLPAAPDIALERRRHCSNRALTAAKEIDSGEGLDEENGRLVIDDGLERGLTHDGVFIVVRDGRGSIIDESVSFPNSGRVKDELWRRVLETGKPEQGRLTFGEEGLAYVYARPVSPPEQAARIVEAGKYYESTQENIERIAFVLASGVTVAFLLSVVGAYLLARRALSPQVRSWRPLTASGQGTSRRGCRSLTRKTRLEISPRPSTTCSLISK